jgi:hypothetical protein
MTDICGCTRTSAANSAGGEGLLGPELERRMEVVEDHRAAGLEQAGGIGRHGTGALGAAAVVEDQQVERCVRLDQPPVAVEDRRARWAARPRAPRAAAGP